MYSDGENDDEDDGDGDGCESKHKNSCNEWRGSKQKVEIDMVRTSSPRRLPAGSVTDATALAPSSVTIRQRPSATFDHI